MDDLKYILMEPIVINMSQHHSFSAESGMPLFRNRKHIRNQSSSLACEQLSFLGGKPLGEIDIFTETGETQRKVRRIIEKRVCQDLHRRGRTGKGNFTRYSSRRRVSNQFRNIFGGIPASMAA